MVRTPHFIERLFNVTIWITIAAYFDTHCARASITIGHSNTMNFPHSTKLIHKSIRHTRFRNSHSFSFSLISSQPINPTSPHWAATAHHKHTSNSVIKVYTALGYGSNCMRTRARVTIQMICTAARIQIRVIVVAFVVVESLSQNRLAQNHWPIICMCIQQKATARPYRTAFYTHPQRVMQSRPLPLW